MKSVDSRAGPVFDVRGLSTSFKNHLGGVHAVNGVDFSLYMGELLGVVGESGSGKSVAMASATRLLPHEGAEVYADRINLNGNDLLHLSSQELRKIYGSQISFIFQNPVSNLNPVFSVGEQIAETLRVHKKMPEKAALERAKELLYLVGMPDVHRCLKAYPHQLSGGMCQRVCIAMALACDPDILIADEPTTALDVTTQAQIIDLINKIRKKRKMSVIWITHDLAVVSEIADRVIVMYGGQIVERAPAGALFSNPQHPYTKALLKSNPRLGYSSEKRLDCISGVPLVMNEPPAACSFRNRCQSAFEPCYIKNPHCRAVDGQPIGHGHDAACHLITCKAAHA